VRIMNKALTAVLTIVAMTAVGGQAMAAKEVHPSCGPAGTWCDLGRTQVDHGKDHDKIVIKGSSDEFRALKLRIKDSPLNIERMVVTYDNGAREEINTRNEIAKGGESRKIDLRGSGKRSRKQVEFWYDTKGILNGKAEVKLFGLR
jgi:hypothetical protein